MSIVNFIVSVIAGIAACIPLVLKLIQYVQKAVKEKNWHALLDLLLSLMEEAEDKFDEGETRKEWVIAMVKTSSEYLNYDMDTDVLDDLIESLIDMSKIVNCDYVEVEEEVNE